MGDSKKKKKPEPDWKKALKEFESANPLPPIGFAVPSTEVSNVYRNKKNPRETRTRGE